MGAKRGRLPEVFVTWLRDLCAGEAQCAFQPWYRARHFVRKPLDETFDRAKWTADHDALVLARAEEGKAAGALSTELEAQNGFALEGQTAAIKGKADLVQRFPDRIVISDGKTGQQKHSDWWQVLIYLFAWPLLPGKDVDRALAGEVVYGTAGQYTVLPVPASDLTEERRGVIVKWMRILASPMPPEKTPSGKECGDCPLTKDMCPAKVEPVIGKTELF